MSSEAAVEEKRKLVRVNLGSGRRPLQGYINVDICSGPGVDLVADLEKPWPWEDNSIDEFNSDDFVEHVRQVWQEPDPGYLEDAEKTLLGMDIGGGTGPHVIGLYNSICRLLLAVKHPKRTYGVIHVANEAWRCLRPHGMFRIKVPSTDGRGAFQDPTHVSYWNENSLLYLLENDVRAGLGSMMKAKFKIVRLENAVSNAKDREIVWLKCVLAKVA